MANPVIIACAVDVWTKVATNITTGVIHILKTTPDAYYQTYRMTGGAAPTGMSEAVPFSDALDISHSAGIDVYIMPTGDSGSVRADL